MTKWDEYRTKRVILEIYDSMQRATETGAAYESEKTVVAAQ